jgi:hypothetical protein
MIYLKPLGGLCNRMRTIDSVVSLCEKYGHALTVLWVMDSSLNCAFEKLFNPLVHPKVVIQVINCPTGFPENFSKIGHLLGGLIAGPTRIDWAFRQLKNLLKGRILNPDQKRISKALSQLNEKNILLNTELAKKYAAQELDKAKSGRDMDFGFISQINEKITSFMNSNGEDKYISSCYRLHAMESHYNYFLPVKSIVEKVESTATKFNKTIGLHIRRSDHVVSRNFSTTDRFLEITNETLAKDPDFSFFVSTDDEPTKKSLISTHGEKIITNEISSYDRNNTEAVIEAMVDLYCLSKTLKVIGSHQSSFSQTAADIGRIEEITAK